MYNKPSKLLSQWQGDDMRTDPTRLETEQWKNIWEREASYNTDVQWLAELRADHLNLKIQ